jgi:sugar/nucleoside kinase (ribokinase family)
MSDVITLGAHIGDVHAWPVEAIPAGQQLSLIEKIKLSVAGTAAGTAVDLAKLGVSVSTIGKVGNDSIGQFVTASMAGRGIDVTGLTVSPNNQTSSSVLPIRPDGSRPALHVIGANADLTEDDIPWDLVAQAKVLHMGGVFVLPGLDGKPMARVLERVKSLGVTVTMDFLMSPRDDAQEILAPCLPFVDYVMPNIEEAGWLVGTEDRAEIIRWLHGQGAGCSVLTMGGDGVSIAEKGQEEILESAFAVDVIDTTGCGDAFSSGFIAGLLAGEALADAATLGLACGSLVATGLGSDAGIVDRAQVEAFRREHPRHR